MWYIHLPMLPEYVKKRVEIRFGKEIRYHKDCEALAIAISHFSGTMISTSTIKRLFGINKSNIKPRIYTLDILARYIGIENWEYAINQGVLNENLFIETSNLLIINNLAKKQTIKLRYNSDGQLHVEYLGDNIFVVVESTDSKLIVQDLLTIMRLEKSYPIVCEKVVRNGKDLGKFVGSMDDVLMGFEIIV